MFFRLLFIHEKNLISIWVELKILWLSDKAALRISYTLKLHFWNIVLGFIDWAEWLIQMGG